MHTIHGFPFHEFQSWPSRNAYVWLNGGWGDHRLLPRGRHRRRGRGGTTRIAPPERIRTIGPAVGTTSPARRRNRDASPVAPRTPAGARVIGTVGRLDYQKAPEHLIKALRVLRDRDPSWSGSAGAVGRKAARWPPARCRRPSAPRRGAVGRAAAAAGARHLRHGKSLRRAALRGTRSATCAVPVVATAVNGIPDESCPVSPVCWCHRNAQTCWPGPCSTCSTSRRCGRDGRTRS